MKTFFNWSTGKDSALALFKLLEDPNYEVGRLLTTINAHHNRVSMHGVQRALLMQQVDSIGLPVSTIELPENASMELYGQIMTSALKGLVQDGYTKAGFGDIFLEDLKSYRETQLQKLNLEGVFPIWKRPTQELVEEMVSLGFKTKVVCVDADLLDESFLGRDVDAQFIKDLPKGVDPCGENGEFHTFCYEGPIFKRKIHFTEGEKVLRSYPLEEGKEKQYWFLDLVPY